MGKKYLSEVIDYERDILIFQTNALGCRSQIFVPGYLQHQQNMKGPLRKKNTNMNADMNCFLITHIRKRVVVFTTQIMIYTSLEKKKSQMVQALQSQRHWQQTSRINYLVICG